EQDILIIQEPCIDFLSNIRATQDWNIIYPSNQHSDGNRTHAVTLINKHLNTNNWCQLPFPFSDIILIQLNGPFSKRTIFNIY
ncbi:uncharacterized protein HD556DRAFT_1187763, partial [Suillus plorans]